MSFSIVFSLIYGILAAGLFLLAARLADRHYRALPIVPTNRPVDLPTSTVAVIVPARNESANIYRVAHTLAALAYPNVRVTVIDDHSEDDTADRARRAGVEVLRLDLEPPPGWTGKCNACEQGVRLTDDRTDWLLFTDADTFHTPDSLTCAIAYAEANRLDALSLLLHQECVSVWDRALLPLAYQQYFAALRLDRAVFNGQYILIRRAVYLKSGGFGAVRGKVMEDVALAESLADQGFRVALANGESLAGVRMYANLPTLWRGLTKTAFAAARDRGLTGFFLAGLTFLGTGLLIGIGWGAIVGNWITVAIGLAVWLLNAILLVPWLRRFDVSPAFGYALLNLPALGLLWLIGLVSTFRALFKLGVHWKGRTIIESAAKSSTIKTSTPLDPIPVKGKQP